ncbi:MAG: helix-turn-helix domain-containing protein [Saprospiraceae bacterium]|nr:helix-turn-helix domain-containing protein [Saprospiraceae bacterium]
MQNIILIPVEDLQNLIVNIIREELQNHRKKVSDPFEEYPELLSRSQVASLLGVSIASIDNWANTGRLKKLRIGSTIRFSKADVIEALGDLQKYQRDAIGRHPP